MSEDRKSLSRRQALALGGRLVGGLVIAASPVAAVPGQAAAQPLGHEGYSDSRVRRLPIDQINQTMRNEGSVTGGVLKFKYIRSDLSVNGPDGLLWLPSFQVKHEVAFQPLAGDRALLIGVVAVLGSEIPRVLARIFSGGLVFMAEHQHFYDEDPQIWHIHMRGKGDPLDLARAMIAVIETTHTPLPQHPPANPTTSLPVDKLVQILGGSATVGKDGVVKIGIPRAETIVLDGVRVRPATGIQVKVTFEPLGGGRAVCAPDYAMIAPEVNPALKLSQDLGYAIHCLYNQETDEHPQLFYSHNLKVGDPVELAREVAQVLDRLRLRRDRHDDHNDD